MSVHRIPRNYVRPDRLTEAIPIARALAVILPYLFFITTLACMLWNGMS